MFSNAAFSQLLLRNIGFLSYFADKECEKSSVFLLSLMFMGHSIAESEILGPNKPELSLSYILFKFKFKFSEFQRTNSI